MIRIRDIKLPVGHPDGAIMNEAADIMCLDKIYPGNSYPDWSYVIMRRSTDARHRPDIFRIYTVKILIEDKEEKRILKFLNDNRKDKRVRKSLEKIITVPVEEYCIPECGSDKLSSAPVIIGSGPAGLFCALLLARKGFRPRLFERGECVEARTKRVEGFWKGEKLSTESNVSFGEGGAGTFSDGKLTTLTKDTKGRNSFVIRIFYEHGANEEITYDAKPHIGTDVLKDVVRNIREEIISLGGEVHFNSKLTDIHTKNGALEAIEITDVNTKKCETIAADVCVLCIGHSARDTFEMLHRSGIIMSQKSFAVGFRIIHSQHLVDMWQYGEDHESLGLPSADYKVTNETAKGRRVYSFCMCPGGYVVNASSEEGRICVNGMSEFKRDSGYANSAVIAAITPDDFRQDDVSKEHPLAGMYYQRNIEKAAFERGEGSIPVQWFEDFALSRTSDDCGSIGESVKGAIKCANMRGIFSEDIDEAIIESIRKFGYTREEFDGKDTALLGVESRTSSPVRIERDENLQSNIKGIYPCGEGAGYAGGIVSAATDGIRCAEKIIETFFMENENG